MVNRASALEGHYTVGRFGTEGDTGVTLTEVKDLTLHQIAFWPDTKAAVAQKAAQAAGTDGVPEPCTSQTGALGSLLRIEPLKWWIFGAEAPPLESSEGATLDLSHSRTHLRITGEKATALLNRLLPLDLREHAFPVGSVASSALHHVGVTLWRSEQGYELFIPRGFALSLWQVIFETAEQFGAEII